MNSCVRSPNLDRLKFEGDYVIELPTSVVDCNVEFKSRYMERKQCLVRKTSATPFQEVAFQMISEAEWDLARSNPSTGARTHFNDDKPIVAVQAWTENKEELVFQFRVTWTTGHINLGKCTEVGFDAEGNLFARNGGQWALVVPHPEKAWSGHHRHARKQRARAPRPPAKRRAIKDVGSQPASPEFPPSKVPIIAKVSSPSSSQSDSDMPALDGLKEIDLPATAPAMHIQQLADCAPAADFEPSLPPLKLDDGAPIYWTESTDSPDSAQFHIGQLPTFDMDFPVETWLA